MCAAKGGNPTCDLAEIVERLETLLGQERVSEDYVRLRIDLLKVQWSARETLAGDSSATHPTTEQVVDDNGRKPAQAGPAMKADAVPFDRASLASLFSAIRACIETGDRQSPDTSRLAAAAERDTTLLEQLARKTAFGPDAEYVGSLAERLDVSSDALLFYGRILAAPFVAAAARRTPRGSDESSGLCPQCGSPPALSRVQSLDGKRVLHCGLCGESWLFSRLACPFCGSRDREVLGFIRVNETDPRWIETCNKCKCYVKTVDERKLPSGERIIPLAEEAATLHLDLVAEKEGCIRRLPYAALI